MVCSNVIVEFQDVKAFFMNKIILVWGCTMTETRTIWFFFLSGSYSLALKLSSKRHQMTIFICLKVFVKVLILNEQYFHLMTF